MAKNAKLPGFTELQDDELEGLAETYDAAREAWQALMEPMLTAKKNLIAAAKKNKNVMEAAKAHPKGKVKVGDAVLTIKAKNPTLDIKVKMYDDGDDAEGAEGSEGGESEAAE